MTTIKETLLSKVQNLVEFTLITDSAFSQSVKHIIKLDDNKYFVLTRLFAKNTNTYSTDIDTIEQNQLACYLQFSTMIITDANEAMNLNGQALGDTFKLLSDVICKRHSLLQAK